MWPNFFTGLPFLFPSLGRINYNTLPVTNVTVGTEAVTLELPNHAFRNRDYVGGFYIDLRTAIPTGTSATLPILIGTNGDTRPLVTYNNEPVRVENLAGTGIYLLHYNKYTNQVFLVSGGYKATATPIMTFDKLNQGDNVYIIEVVGTFKKTTEYNVGTVISVSNAYDEPLQPGQFQLPNQPRKKLIDVTIQCNGEQKKFSIPENRTVITDNNLGLTISTDKQEIVGIIRNQYNTYKARKESIAKCDEEMSKCQALLEKLDIPKEPTNTEDPRLKELQDEVNELKNIIKQASSMVPPPMKQMLPQNMQNVMKEVDQ